MTVDSCIIVGGGLVGLATAMRLKRQRRTARFACSRRNRAMGHTRARTTAASCNAGLYYKLGSLKTQLAVSGIRQMADFFWEQNVHHEICGKVVVATTVTEVDGLKALLDSGTRNGLRGLRGLSGDELREVEPHAAGVAAVQVLEEGIVDYAGVCMAVHRELTCLGVDVRASARVVALRREATGWRVVRSAGDWYAAFIVIASRGSPERWTSPRSFLSAASVTGCGRQPNISSAISSTRFRIRPIHSSASILPDSSKVKSKRGQTRF